MIAIRLQRFESRPPAVLSAAGCSRFMLKMSAGFPRRRLVVRASSVQSKAHFHADLHGNGTPVFRRRFEAPFLNGFDCLLVQTHSNSALNMDVPGCAAGVYDHREYTGSFESGLTCFFRVLRIRSREWLGR